MLQLCSSVRVLIVDNQTVRSRRGCIPFCHDRIRCPSMASFRFDDFRGCMSCNVIFEWSSLHGHRITLMDIARVTL
jgi:hypothetical protein